MGKAPTPTEAQLQHAVVDLLAIYERTGILTFLRVNSGQMFVQDGGRSRKISLAPAGTSDLIIFFRGAKTAFVELKRDDPKCKQTKQQKEFQEKVMRLGFSYHLCRTVGQVLSIIKVYGQ